MNGQRPVTYTTRSLCQQMCLLSAKKVNSYEERKNKLQYRKTTLRRLQNEINEKTMKTKLGLVVRATEEETYFEE